MPILRTMINNGQSYSLLPYLNAVRGNFHLQASLISDDSAVLERASFPFLTITDTDPLTRLIEAGIRTDAGSEIEKVFLLLQRDRYLLAKDELWPVSNRDINDAWQKAFVFYSSEKEDNSFITLAGQLDDQGRPAQLAPLFYCKTRQLFFHPPCPKCGLPLQQCGDEDLLSAAGLLSCSGSLKRYLYCRSCASAGRPEFYVYETEQSDPQTLRDRFSLIRKFKLLIEGNRNVEQFPCIGCPNYKDCYGAEQRVISRIVPFSFYPFHMFIFKALSLNALDFLPLVSGATFRELETELEKKGEHGRINCLRNVRRDDLIKAPCLFDSGSRNFLEVLYLKLTFLAEVFQGISAGHEALRHPDMRLSLDRIWVKLPEHSGRLPFLWDFRVRFIDIFRQQTDKTSSLELPGANSLFFMGLAWFYALLVNRRQDFSKVCLSLKEIMDKFSQDSGFSFEKCINEGPCPAFLPSNLFREPEGKTVTKDALQLWEKSLQAGWSVLNAGYHPAEGFSLDNFLQQLDEIREEVKGRLFAEAPADERQPEREEDKAISGILKNIYDKWGSLAEMEEEALTETVVLTPENAGKKTAPAEKQEEILTETVIISAQEMKDTLKPSPGTQVEKTVPAGTVIISAGDAGRASKPAGEQPEAGPPAEQGGVTGETEEQKKKKEQDFLAETIILKPGELKGKGKR